MNNRVLHVVFLRKTLYVEPFVVLRYRSISTHKKSITEKILISSPTVCPHAKEMKGCNGFSCCESSTKTRKYHYFVEKIRASVKVFSN